MPICFSFALCQQFVNYCLWFHTASQSLSGRSSLLLTALQSRVVVLKQINSVAVELLSFFFLPSPIIMNCLQCRAHWFFTALEKLLMNSTEVSGENLALKRRHPASTPPPPPPLPSLLTHWAPSAPPLSLFKEQYFQRGRNAALKIYQWFYKKKKTKVRGRKSASAQGTTFSCLMWK